jgi:hypothetical protein
MLKSDFSGIMCFQSVLPVLIFSISDWFERTVLLLINIFVTDYPALNEAALSEVASIMHYSIHF